MYGTAYVLVLFFVSTNLLTVRGIKCHNFVVQNNNNRTLSVAQCQKQQRSAQRCMVEVRKRGADQFVEQHSCVLYKSISNSPSCKMNLCSQIDLKTWRCCCATSLCNDHALMSRLKEKFNLTTHTTTAMSTTSTSVASTFVEMSTGQTTEMFASSISFGKPTEGATETGTQPASTTTESEIQLLTSPSSKSLESTTDRAGQTLFVSNVTFGVNCFVLSRGQKHKTWEDKCHTYEGDWCLIGKDTEGMVTQTCAFDGQCSKAGCVNISGKRVCCCKGDYCNSLCLLQSGIKEVLCAEMAPTPESTIWPLYPLLTFIIVLLIAVVVLQLVKGKIIKRRHKNKTSLRLVFRELDRPNPFEPHSVSVATAQSPHRVRTPVASERQSKIGQKRSTVQESYIKVVQSDCE